MHAIWRAIKKIENFHMNSSQLPASLPRVNEQRLYKAQEGQKSSRYVIGVDEAGRGPLAGPVVAAAFVLCTPFRGDSRLLPLELSRGITDSKQVDEEVREYLYNEKMKGCLNVQYAFSVVDNKVIDKINILQATFLAMTQSVESLVSRIRLDDPKARFAVLIDGNKVPPQLHAHDFVCESLIKGDSIEFVIAAASICAKVERDLIMHTLHEEYPQYNFKQHKGYPTGGHVAAIRTHGPCKHHRLTFAPLKSLKKVATKIGQVSTKPIDEKMDEREARMLRRARQRGDN